MAIQILDSTARVLGDYPDGQVISFDGIGFIIVDGNDPPTSTATEKCICITARDGNTHSTDDNGANWS